ncbi:MAG: hypothetical protein KJZ83_15665 [Burkholderiaceae bacterium]|nr:hypothetical protein [Burkholderiaceae bacterium]
MREAITTPFRHRSEMRDAVIDALAQCRHRADLLDARFDDWPLESAQGEAALRALLARGARVRLLLTNAEWLERRAARLRGLRREHAAQVAIRQLPEGLRLFDCLLLVDGQHMVRRPHRDAMRGVYVQASPSRCEPYCARFEAAWQESCDCLPATTLGL